MPTLNHVLNYIDENLGAELQVSDLAKLTHISVAYFFRTFRLAVGISPAKYLTNRRLEQAKQLMLRTDRPLAQIAHDCGFCDQSHFNRVFRRRIGTTPAAWRRAPDI
jgi:transcriptional regulator GlxA family with amidase domain